MSTLKKAIILFFLSCALFVLMDLRRADPNKAPMCILEQTGDILPCDTTEAELTAIIDKSVIPSSN